MKIVIPDWSTMSAVNMGFSVFEEFGEVVCCGMTRPEEAAEKIGDADVVLVNKTPITAQVMDACPNLKYIGLFATGYNNIDIPAATARGITVCNAGTYSTDAVVQHTFALLLSLAGNLPRYEKAVADGEWERSETFSYFPYPVHELCGKTFGLYFFHLDITLPANEVFWSPCSLCSCSGIRRDFNSRLRVSLV